LLIDDFGHWSCGKILRTFVSAIQKYITKQYKRIHNVIFRKHLINHTNLYRMSNSLQELVDEIQFKLKCTQEDIAKRIGYSRPYLSNAIKKNTKGKIFEAIKREFAEILQNVSKKEYPIINENENHTNESIVNYEKTQPGAPLEDYQATIRDLSRSIVVIAEANKIVAEGNKVLSDSNKLLSENNSVLVTKFNLSNPPKISSILEPYLQKIILAGVGKFWTDESAGRQELGKILNDHLKEKTISGN